MNSPKEYRHWYYEKDEEAIVWLRIDVAEKSTNVLSEEVLLELDSLLDILPSLTPRGVIIHSGKKRGFIAGADISAFTKLSSREEALKLIYTGQRVFDKLEQIPFPTLAMISGFCLGGGLELALACNYRVAADSPETKLGLPEVKLGIHPGFGGTVRLNHLIGGVGALPLMMAGKVLDSHRAKRLGIVDQAVPLRLLEKAAKKVLLEGKPRKKMPFLKRLGDTALMRPILAPLFLKKLKKKVNKHHYPAPFSLLKLWEKNGSCRKERCYNDEAQSVADLITKATAQNLTRVFFLQEKMKSQAADKQFQPKHVHVVGGGIMGGDIAAWCALNNLQVTVQDQHPEALAPMLQRAHKLFSFKLRKKHLIQAAMDRLQPDVSGDGVAKADVIIEAIFENVDAKKELFSTLEPRMKKSAILATNTSSIPLETLSESLNDPTRLIGLHFFNPVSKMQLVEVVHSEKTAQEWFLKGVAFTKGIKKLPVPTKSSPGFLVNRILMPYLHEAMLLAKEELPYRAIDKAATKFGMPVGPIELIDMVGLDICQSVSDFMQNETTVMPDIVASLLSQGKKGKKSGSGFYSYKKGKAVKPQLPKNWQQPADICDRLILRMLNECAACLREEIVADAEMLDGGLIFGTGFAPFRGGPSHYMQENQEELMTKLRNLEAQYGSRFTPDPGWEQLAGK